MYDKAATHGCAFDFLAPQYLPAGYRWDYGQVTVTTRNPDGVYFEVHFQNLFGSDEIFLMDYSQRETFNPPSNCGYNLGPVKEFDKDPAKPYPCQLIGNTASGRQVYFYSAPSGDNSDEVDDYYFMAYGRDVAVVSVGEDKSSQSSPPRSEVLKVLESLHPLNMGEIVKYNIHRGY